LKFRKNSICCAATGKTKINSIKAIRYNSHAVDDNKNPFCNVLIYTAVPESKRNNLHKQIYQIGIKQRRNVKLKTAFQQSKKMRKGNIREITFIDKKKEYAANIINCQHQRKVVNAGC
jgi:hypothetical protein